MHELREYYSFAIVESDILKNKEMSLAAKGLYAILVNEERNGKQKLEKIRRNYGIKKKIFYTTLDELQSFGISFSDI